MSNPIRPPFTLDTARAKVQAAQDAWNSRDPDRVALAYTEDSEWRNRTEFFRGRDAIRAFLKRKWATELDYGSRKSCGAFVRTASPCGSSTSGMTIEASGFAPTVTNSGSSTTTA